MNVCKCSQRTLLGLLAALLLLPTLALSDGADRSPVERPLIQKLGPPMQPVMADPEDYTGFLRLFVVEPLSRWKASDSKNFYNGFLNLPLDSSIVLADGTRYHLRYYWTHTHSNIQENNIAVAATIVNNDWSINYSNPPSGASFYAFPVDAATFASAGETDSNKTAPGFTHTVWAEDGSTST